VYPPPILGTVAVLLIVPGLIAPTLLRHVERGWMWVGGWIGEINGRIILTVLFYGVIWPIGRVLRLKRDPLDRSLTDGKTSTWIKRERVPVDPERYERQF
jgi:hypothetical protein